MLASALASYKQSPRKHSGPGSKSQAHVSSTAIAQRYGVTAKIRSSWSVYEPAAHVPALPP